MSLAGGRSVEDKLWAVKYFFWGQGICFVALKATSSELFGPKKKHLNYLVSVTNEPNVSIPNLTKYLMRRALHPEWQVAFKALITTHYLMNYGNERFIQNLASSTVNNRAFDQMASFVDRGSYQAYDMSTFVRRYSRYISTKIQTYRSLGLDFCRIQPNGDRLLVRIKRMDADELLTILPVLQNQFDSLIGFDASAKELNNGIVNSAFSSLYKDFVKLYLAYQTGINRLLELYFETDQLRRAQELYEVYKKFLIRMDKVSDFMRVIDCVGMDKSDMPNVSRLPNSVSIKLLEKHMKQLETLGKRRASLDRATINHYSTMELPSLYGGGSNVINGASNYFSSSLTRKDISSPYSNKARGGSLRRLSASGSSGRVQSNGSTTNQQQQPIPKLRSPEIYAQRKGKRRQLAGDYATLTGANSSNLSFKALEEQPKQMNAKTSECDIKTAAKLPEPGDLLMFEEEEEEDKEKEEKKPTGDLMVSNSNKTEKESAMNHWVRVEEDF